MKKRPYLLSLPLCGIRAYRQVSVVVAFIGLCLASCTISEFDTATALNAYVASPENGLLQESTINGYHIKVTYRPTDLIVDQEMGDAPYDSALVRALRKKYSAYYYFILSLSRDNKEALHSPNVNGQYGSLVQTLSFQMANYVNLTTPSDTVAVSDFVLNRSYGLNSFTDLLFVFSRAKAMDDQWVQFNLHEFGLGVGNQRFQFKTGVLDKAPGIDFSKARAGDHPG